jgi:hypothetical protein
MQFFSEFIKFLCPTNVNVNVNVKLRTHLFSAWKLYFCGAHCLSCLDDLTLQKAGRYECTGFLDGILMWIRLEMV